MLSGTASLQIPLGFRVLGFTVLVRSNDAVLYVSHAKGMYIGSVPCYQPAISLRSVDNLQQFAWKFRDILAATDVTAVV